MTYTKKERASFMEELHIQHEARLIANDNILWPLAQSKPPTDAQIAEVRERWQRAQDRKKEDA